MRSVEGFGDRALVDIGQTPVGQPSQRPGDLVGVEPHLGRQRRRGRRTGAHQVHVDTTERGFHGEHLSEVALGECDVQRLVVPEGHLG